MSEDIKAVEVLETEYGEKVVIDSPYEAKEFINALPWRSLSDEEEEYGSLRERLESRDVDGAAIDAAEDFGFSDEFSSHAKWEPDAMGEGDGAWLVDVDTWDETREFFEFSGFEVESEIDL